MHHQHQDTAAAQHRHSAPPPSSRTTPTLTEVLAPPSEHENEVTVSSRSPVASSSSSSSVAAAASLIGRLLVANDGQQSTSPSSQQLLLSYTTPPLERRTSSGGSGTNGFYGNSSSSSRISDQVMKLIEAPRPELILSRPQSSRQPAIITSHQAESNIHDRDQILKTNNSPNAVVDNDRTSLIVEPVANVVLSGANLTSVQMGAAAAAPSSLDQPRQARRKRKKPAYLQQASSSTTPYPDSFRMASKYPMPKLKFHHHHHQSKSHQSDLRPNSQSVQANAARAITSKRLIAKQSQQLKQQQHSQRKLAKKVNYQPFDDHLMVQQQQQQQQQPTNPIDEQPNRTYQDQSKQKSQLNQWQSMSASSLPKTLSKLIEDKLIQNVTQLLANLTSAHKSSGMLKLTPTTSVSRVVGVLGSARRLVSASRELGDAAGSGSPERLADAAMTIANAASDAWKQTNMTLADLSSYLQPDQTRPTAWLKTTSAPSIETITFKPEVRETSSSTTTTPRPDASGEFTTVSPNAHGSSSVAPAATGGAISGENSTTRVSESGVVYSKTTSEPDEMKVLPAPLAINDGNNNEQPAAHLESRESKIATTKITQPPSPPTLTATGSATESPSATEANKPLKSTDESAISGSSTEDDQISSSDKTIAKTTTIAHEVPIQAKPVAGQQSEQQVQQQQQQHQKVTKRKQSKQLQQQQPQMDQSQQQQQRSINGVVKSNKRRDDARSTRITTTQLASASASEYDPTTASAANRDHRYDDIDATAAAAAAAAAKHQQNIKLFHFKRKPDLNKLPFYKKPLNYTELGWTAEQIQEHLDNLAALGLPAPQTQSPSQATSGATDAHQAANNNANNNGNELGGAFREGAPSPSATVKIGSTGKSGAKLSSSSPPTTTTTNGESIEADSSGEDNDQPQDFSNLNQQPSSMILNSLQMQQQHQQQQQDRNDQQQDKFLLLKRKRRGGRNQFDRMMADLHMGFSAETSGQTIANALQNQLSSSPGDHLNAAPATTMQLNGDLEQTANQIGNKQQQQQQQNELVPVLKKKIESLVIKPIFMHAMLNQSRSLITTTTTTTTTSTTPKPLEINNQQRDRGGRLAKQFAGSEETTPDEDGDQMVDDQMGEQMVGNNGLSPRSSQSSTRPIIRMRRKHPNNELPPTANNNFKQASHHHQSNRGGWKPIERTSSSSSSVASSSEQLMLVPSGLLTPSGSHLIPLIAKPNLQLENIDTEQNHRILSQFFSWHPARNNLNVAMMQQPTIEQKQQPTSGLGDLDIPAALLSSAGDVVVQASGQLPSISAPNPMVEIVPPISMQSSRPMIQSQLPHQQQPKQHQHHSIQNPIPIIIANNNNNNSQTGANSGELKVPKLLVKPMRPAKYSLNGYIPKPSLQQTNQQQHPVQTGAAPGGGGGGSPLSSKPINKNFPTSSKPQQQQTTSQMNQSNGATQFNGRDLDSSTSNEIFSRRRGLNQLLMQQQQQQQQQRSAAAAVASPTNTKTTIHTSASSVELASSNGGNNNNQRHKQQLEENKRKYLLQSQNNQAKSPTPLSAKNANLIKAKLGLSLSSSPPTSGAKTPLKSPNNQKTPSSHHHRLHNQHQHQQQAAGAGDLDSAGGQQTGGASSASAPGSIDDENRFPAGVNTLAGQASTNSIIHSNPLIDSSSSSSGDEENKNHKNNLTTRSGASIDATAAAAASSSPNGIPKTDFECTDKGGKFVSGLFADHKTGCQVWHLCSNNRKYSFLCPAGTVFNSKARICDWRYNVKCEPDSLLLGAGTSSTTTTTTTNDTADSEDR